MAGRRKSARKKTVLLCWELGGGTGYTAWLVDIARRLQAAGCAPVLALRELVPCIHLTAGLEAPVLAAPVAPGLLPDPGRGFYPCGFADLMQANGFGRTHELNALVRGWRGLIDTVKPDLVVGAYSPVLGVAAYGRVPLALIGYGYTLPPADQATFPLFRSDRKPYADQGELLARVRRVQESLGAPLPERLTDIHRGDARFVLSFPEIDPYKETRHEPVVGALEDLGPIPPLPAAPRFYAYLVGGKPFVRDVVEGLLRCGLPGAIYLRGPNIRPPRNLDRLGIEWLTRPPPLAEAIAGASLVVHHGGANTLHAALAAARPQVLAPRNLDQSVMAQEAEDFRIAVRLEANPTPEAVAGTLRRVATEPQLLRNLNAYARLVRARGQHDALPEVVESCLALLA
ncbi:MAG: hypothetical protein MI920_00815 [Kiloniellales bacterium]|nr:hypothetical protein [Kiloniellales bacterium]